MDLLNKILYIFEFITIVYQIILGVVFENCAQNVNTARLFCHKNLSSQAGNKTYAYNYVEMHPIFFETFEKAKIGPFFDFVTHESILQWGNMIFLE